MNQLNYPAFDCKIKEADGKFYIFDGIRKKYLVLTPEEWVRQHIVNFLVHHREYPKSLIKLEGGTKFNSVKGRFDIVVHTREGEPFFLIECKAPEVKLAQRDLEQLAIYNLKQKATFVMLTNGIDSHVFQVDIETKASIFQSDIPVFPKKNEF